MSEDQSDAAIQAGKHFGIHRWTKLRHAALRLAMAENEVLPERRDARKIGRILLRFRIGDAFAFYNERPDFWRPG